MTQFSADIARLLDQHTTCGSIRLLIIASQQRLYLLNKDTSVQQSMTISTALAGIGQNTGSQQTPQGLFKIAACIGQGLPINSVFRGRRWTGEVYSEALGRQFSKRDWILSRILWLDGCEPGINKFGAVDTMKRMIYIHGTADELGLGTNLSHGCIRMSNQNIVDIFGQVKCGNLVLIA